MPGGAAFYQPEPSVGPKCPMRLEAESSATFFVEPAAVGAALEAFKLKPVLCASVQLGSGRIIKSATRPAADFQPPNAASS